MRLLLALAVLCACPGIAAAAVDDTVLVNRIGATGPVADAPSGGPSISDDGRLIAFWTQATNLGLGPGLYVKDMVAGTVTLVDAASVAQQPRLSDNGRFVCFIDDDAGTLRAAVRELATGAVRLAGPSSLVKGGPSDFDFSERYCDVSDDGNRLVYASSAALDPADTESGGALATFDVYLRDFSAATDTLVSRVDGAAGADGDGFSLAPSITPDGRHVLFRSRAANLSAEDSDELSDIFLRDTLAGTTTWVSRADGPAGGVGTPNANPTNATSGAVDAAMSDDARVVAFQSFVKGLDPSAPPSPASAQVYVRDLTAATTRVAAVTRTPTGERQASFANTNVPTISGDGAFVGFGSAFGSLDQVVSAPDLTEEIYVRALAQDRTSLVSRESGVLGAAANQFSFVSMLSGDGRFDVFTSDATNLGDSPGYVGPPAFGRASGRDIFVRELDPARPLVADLPGPPPLAVPDLLSTVPAVLAPVQEHPLSEDVKKLVAVLQARASRHRPPARAAATAAKAAPRAIDVKLGEYGRLTLVVERLAPGRRRARSGSRCRPPAQAPRRAKRPCTRIRTVATRTVAGYEGTGAVDLATVLGERRLPAGLYRVRTIVYDLSRLTRARARTFRVR